MNRDTLLRLIAATPLAGPLAMLGAKAAPLAENGAKVAVPVAGAVRGPAMASVYAVGMNPETGQSVEIWVGQVEAAALRGGGEEAAVALRGVEDEEGVLTKFGFLDKLTANWYDRGTNAWRFFHAPLVAGQLPLGWTTDMTGFYQDAWEALRI